MQEWLAKYADGIGKGVKEAAKYNDDRLARSCVDGLYDADRNSLMTEISSNAIKIHELETEILHNDTTSLSLHGAYNNSTSTDGIKPARGYNKDGYPDCKQIVFGVNVTEDGHVPISYMAYNGNTTDDKTHIPNWNKLREVLSKDDFVYVTDSKGSDTKILGHIAGHGGKFISMLPATRREIKEFHTRLKNEEIPWEKGYEQEDSRKKGKFTTYLTLEEAKSHEGYRIVWVHSDSKAQHDAQRRQRQIAEACKNLQTLAPKLNRRKLKTRVQIQQAVDKAVKGVSNYVVCEIIEHTTTSYKQIGRGKAGPNTCTKEVSQTSYQLDWQRNITAIREAACTDGVFPLINNTDLSATEVLGTYKQQPYLEKRHSTLKTVEKVCPVYFKKPERIEAMLFLYFVALMIISLMERNIRRAMQKASNFSQVEPVVTPENQPVSLPKKVVVLPKKEEPTSVKKRNTSTKQTTLPNKIILLPEKKQPALSIERNILPEEQKEAVLLKEPVTELFESKQPAISIEQNASSEEQKEAVLLKKPVMEFFESKQPALPDETIILPEQKQTTFPNKNRIMPEERIALPILPQGMKTKTPTWENIKYMFENVHQIVFTSGESILKTTLKAMTPLHFQVLEWLCCINHKYFLIIS